MNLQFIQSIQTIFWWDSRTLRHLITKNCHFDILARCTFEGEPGTQDEDRASFLPARSRSISHQSCPQICGLESDWKISKTAMQFLQWSQAQVHCQGTKYVNASGGEIPNDGETCIVHRDEEQ